MTFVHYLLLYLALGFVGALIGFLIARAHDQWKKGAGITAGLMVGLAVALVCQAALNWLVSMPQQPSADGGVSAPSVPTSESTSPSATSASTATTVTSESSPSTDAESPSPAVEPPSSTDAAPPSPPGPSEYYLADLGPLETEKEGRAGRCTGGCTGFGGGPGRIEGIVYPNSFLMEVAADGRRSTAVWNLARSCTILEVTVGVDDKHSPRARVTFTLSKDGSAPAKLATVGLSEPAHIRKNINGTAQIEIAAYVSGPEAPSDVDVVLGDARVTCKPGSLGDGS